MNWHALASFASAVVLASLHFSGCGESERPPSADSLFGTRAEPIPYDRLPPTTEAFTERRCWATVEGRATQCGTVVIGESSEQSSAMIELGIARVFAEADREPKADPIVFLEGGPGGAVVRNVDLVFSAFEEFARDRDVIFIDQRGTGVSRPALTCTESGPIEEAVGECFERLSEGSDLSTYNTTSNARDVELVRQALGYQQWNLLGISYGTRLALTIMRDHPQGVRSAILDAVVPLEADLLANLGVNAQRSFESVFALCQSQPECAEKYPDSMRQLRSVVQRLNDEPIELDDAELDGDAFVSALFNLLYSPLALRFVPQVINAADQGDFELFADLGPATLDSEFSFGMHLSVQCADELPFTSEDEIAAQDAKVHEELVSGLSGREYLKYCESWKVTPAPDIENAPVRSAIPTLVFAGLYDPVTPPAYSQQVDESLSNSQYFLVTNGSHGSSVTECGAKLTRTFLDAPQEPVAAACLEELPELSFLGRQTAGRRVQVGRSIVLATKTPTAQEVQAAKEDLRLRVLF